MPARINVSIVKRGDHESCGERIDPSVAADAVVKLAKKYKIETVMVFGGEPLLYTDAVYSIMNVAKELGIPRRQIITNGYFSLNGERIRDVAKMLSLCSVNDLLLSVDAFHQETIPIEPVKIFACEALDAGIPVSLSPAWVVSVSDDNPYNVRTREILEKFSDIDVKVVEGNIVFPEGNAKKYLAEYFKCDIPENPYIEDPCDVKCISISPNGDVLGGNIYMSDVVDILEKYTP